MNERTSAANRATWIGFGSNLALATFKLFAGIIGHSGAMIADAMHSLSDFASDIVVLIGFRFVGKPADKSHDYGHGKYETLVTVVVGGILLLVGVGILWDGVVKIRLGLEGELLAAPGGIALVAAIISVVVKEWLYRYTITIGKKINSKAVVANAWHHRSDALSSIGTVLGVGGAIVLGEKWHILDPIAAVIVSIFIIKVALDISSGSIRELTDESLSDEAKQEIIQIASAFSTVTDPHNLKTRRIGSDVAIDLHIRVAHDMCVADAHDITNKIEAEIRRRFGQSAFISIHVEPNANSETNV